MCGAEKLILFEFASLIFFPPEEEKSKLLDLGPLDRGPWTVGRGPGTCQLGVGRRCFDLVLISSWIYIFKMLQLCMILDVLCES